MTELPVTELRVYLQLQELQPQFSAWLSTALRARAYPPVPGQHSLMLEVAPALAIHRITDLALKAAPDMEPGLLYTERQFGLLELHADEHSELDKAGRAILAGLAVSPEQQLAPTVLFDDIVTELSDQHAIVLNRSREASMYIPGDSLLIVEMIPALFACLAANEAEKAAAGITINDVQMMGASGRVFISGEPAQLELAGGAILDALSRIKGQRRKRR